MKRTPSGKVKTLNMLTEDLELADRLRRHLERSMGMKLSAMHVARLAYRALARELKIDLSK